MGNKKKYVLPILSYYLTFIHYFGFSINPDVESGNNNNKRRLEGSISSSYADLWLYLPRGSGLLFGAARKPFKTCIKFVAISFNTFIAFNHVIVLADYIYQGSKGLEELMLDIRIVITKFSALIFVLSWHINQQKVRRLIKLVRSTSIYILGTQMGGHLMPKLQHAAAARIWQGKSFGASRELKNKRKLTQPQVGWRLEGEDAVEEELDEISDELHMDARQIDRRIFWWWFMCIFVTVLHFSLSEAEINHSHHLWQWLDDYSMHQLNNQTTSNSTLMFLATFDNYIYTVHVYGTRLIGASIICIVCSLQRENIDRLRWHTLSLLQTPNQLRQLKRHRAFNGLLNLQPQQQQQQQQQRKNYHAQPFAGSLANYVLSRRANRYREADESKLMTTTRASSGNENENDSERASCKSQDSSCSELSDCELLFALGDSNWLSVCQNENNLKPCGQLSSSLHFASGWLVAQSSESWRLFLTFCEQNYRLLMDFLLTWRADRSKAKASLATTTRYPANSRVTPSPTCSPSATFDHVAFSVMPTIYNGNKKKSDATNNIDFLQPTPNNGCQVHADYRHFSMADHETNYDSGSNHESCHRSADFIEWQLERLAGKYELVRTVNARIDSCFGPMLLIQYSSLFLMSCIDVVYFSICFNPNTKTKYIIISGMILLWWPYLLLYKFASDIGSSSKELLISVRRLARLSLIEFDSHAQATGGSPMPLITAGYSPIYRRFRQYHYPTTGITIPDGSSEGSEFKPVERSAGTKTRARIINKLDHVFKPTNLSIIGVMTIDKFFLLNFAKIVITASVMIIQFISHKLDP